MLGKCKKNNESRRTYDKDLDICGQTVLCPTLKRRCLIERGRGNSNGALKKQSWQSLVKMRPTSVEQD